MAGEAVQVVTAGEGSEGFRVTPALAEVLGRVPEDCKVSVLSVVGAFRTGKSFLLSLFLRYLRHTAGHKDEASSTDTSWLTSEGDFLSEGNLNDSENSADADGCKSFPWRGGQARQTLGM